MDPDPDCTLCNGDGWDVPGVSPCRCCLRDDDEERLRRIGELLERLGFDGRAHRRVVSESELRSIYRDEDDLQSDEMLEYYADRAAEWRYED